MPWTRAVSEVAAGTAQHGFPAVFFDGESSERLFVRMVPESAVLKLLDAAGREWARWPWNGIRRISQTPRLLRLSCADGPELARLDVSDAAAIDAILARAQALDHALVRERRGHRKLVGWCVAAAVSVTLFGIFGVPALADRIAVMLPWSVDRQIGAAMDGQVRQLLQFGRSPSSDCGSRPGEEAGLRVMRRLVARMEAEAGLPVPLTVSVLRSDMENAFATPGGYVYILDGLIQKSESPDELAGVLAHEIGHVAARDGTRRLIQTSGMAFLFGTVFGDFTGGGAVILGGRVLTEAAYSREAESRADDFAAAMMNRLDADPAAMGRLLLRISDEEKDAKDSWSTLVSSHPFTPDRLSRLEAAASGQPVRPVLDEAEWRLLKSVCGNETADPAKSTRLRKR